MEVTIDQSDSSILVYIYVIASLDYEISLVWVVDVKLSGTVALIGLNHF